MTLLSHPGGPGPAPDDELARPPAGTVGGAPAEVADGTAGPDGEPVRPDAPGPAPDEGREAPFGRIVTVFSAKGGAGKTVVATNLAVLLGARGARRVCLVDLDLEFGDVAIMLQLAPTRGIVDALEFDLGDDTALDAVVTAYRPNLDCVLAPITPGDFEKITPALVASLLERLRSRYDYIVVDTPPQLSEHVLEAFDAADHHVLVSTPEIPSLKNLRLTLDMLDLLAYGAQQRSVLLNRAEPKAGVTRTDAEAALGTPVTAVLPATPDASASVNRGLPLAAGRPNHPFTAALREFTDRVLVVRDDVPAARPAGRFGLTFRRRSA